MTWRLIAPSSSRWPVRLERPLTWAIASRPNRSNVYQEADLHAVAGGQWQR